ncbi:uncharacterized protein LOC125514074 [Triticum urartu]|uniref:uncharacterized protein LOC125514074 n=1 Tax=Triticum urartu TaxID=4572 RepID=UPI002043C635|nr:uncharacterized protein LOC125514074 [Triticum urartu]
MPSAFTPCPAKSRLAAMTARLCRHGKFFFSFPYLQNKFRSLSRLNKPCYGLVLILTVISIKCCMELVM